VTLRTDDFQLLDVVVADRVATVTIDAPPINVMTVPLMLELSRCLEAVAADDAVTALILRSADPDFFIAHFDVAALLDIPIEDEPVRDDQLNGFHRMCELARTMPKATICEVAGRVGGGGAELASSFDMRFGATGRFALNQMEVPLGILPGGTGTQRLPRLVGSGRALEIVLGGVDVDAETAERWGWLNRALPADALRPFVDGLARRIASFPPGAVARAKASIRNADDLPLRQALLEESHLFAQTLRDPAAQRRMAAYLEVGGQTREVELRIEDVSGDLG
jgi:enoyl-CoA hydratase/carnithine racemase